MFSIFPEEDCGSERGQLAEHRQFGGHFQLLPHRDGLDATQSDEVGVGRKREGREVGGHLEQVWWEHRHAREVVQRRTAHFPQVGLQIKIINQRKFMR